MGLVLDLQSVDLDVVTPAEEYLSHNSIYACRALSVVSIQC